MFQNPFQHFGRNGISALNQTKIGLIGCHGRMGSMLSERWKAAGYEVFGIDLPFSAQGFRSVTERSRALVLCIPAGALSETLALLIPYLDGKQILLDITSVKMRPLAQMDAAYSGPVVGTHPLFGPQNGIQRVCITPGSHVNEESVLFVEQLFFDIGCTVFRSTAEKHDRAAAAIQGLNFITSVAYFATLAHREDILPYLTPSFLRRREAAKKMLTEDAELFEWLFEANPLSQDEVRRYRSFLNIAAGGDVNLLVEQARWWWEQKLVNM